jgi:hypothetical protein
MEWHHASALRSFVARSKIFPLTGLLMICSRDFCSSRIALATSGFAPDGH